MASTQAPAPSGAAAQPALVAAGNVRHASRLITQIENGHPAARDTLRALAPHCGTAQIVGVTGAPGTGKSSLTAALIQEFRRSHRTVGVVAVDPSSPFSGGALLGDRDRMLEASSGDPGVFIRSVAARGAQGGLAPAVDDAVDVMDAAGHDVVIIETVGVGQGELEIARIAHTVVLVVVPGYGDSLQAMKAGITEIAEVVALNKGDMPGAEQLLKDLRSQGYERRYPAAAEPWPVPVTLTSALRHEGVDDLVAVIDEHYAFGARHGQKGEVERLRRRARFISFVEARLHEQAHALTDLVSDRDIQTDPFGAAEQCVDRLLHGAWSPQNDRTRAGLENAR